MSDYTAIWLEDFQAGQRAVYGRETFEREAMLSFSQMYDPQSFHLDDEAAANSHFGALVASGWHTGAACMKHLAAYHFALRDGAKARGEPLPALGPSPGFKNLKWPRPVYEGDTITFSGEITGTRKMESRPGWGLIFLTPKGHNQNGDEVFSYDSTVMIACRGNVGT